MIRLALCAFVCLSLAGCVTNNVTTQNAQLASAPRAATPAAPRPAPARILNVHKTTTSGASLTLVSLESLADDCTPLGEVVVKVMTPPLRGMAYSERGMAFPRYPPHDPHAVCNTKKNPATLAFYRSAPGFVGADRVVLRAFFPDGKALTILFHIAVQ